MAMYGNMFLLTSKMTLRSFFKLVSHQETTAWQLLATLTTAFLNDCLTNLSKYLAIVVYND